MIPTMNRVVAARGSCLRKTVLLLASMTWAAAPAGAQDVGIRAGVSGGPDQFFFGGHLETGELLERLTFRPNAEIGIGDDVTVVAINLEFAYRFPSNRAWLMYVGGGPALNIIDHDEDTSPEGGFNILIGAEHRGGLFVELKVGLADSPEAKLGVGFSFP
jgi:hypothetical protein